MAASPAPGLYLHVPFCAHRCGYCDFNVATGSDAALRARYARALQERLAVLARAGPAAVAPTGGTVDASWSRSGGEWPTSGGTWSTSGREWPTFGSLFVGGGTPTLLEPHDLAAVLRRVSEAFPLADDVEITVEGNPETLTRPGPVDRSGPVAAPEQLAPLVEAGLSRLSLGAQSTSTAVLDALDRRHAPETVPAAVEAARQAGVDQVAVDLIYGTPGESDAEWSHSLADVLDLGVDHVSAYALTLAPNTPYARAVAQGERSAPDEDVAADRMAIADAALGAAGLERYEVSNWARPGARCRHNLATWQGGDYLAAGAGAHGLWAGRRWWEIRATSAWLRAVEGRREGGRVGLARDPVVGGDELPDADGRRAERLMTGLRILEGVPRAAVEPVDERAVGQLTAAGLLRDDGERLRPTREGLAKVDGMALALLP